MKSDFDKPIDRTGTHSVKCDAMPSGVPQDALSLWVADINLPCAQPILDALHQRIDRKIFGYTLYENDELKDAVTGWYQRHFGWIIDKSDLFYSPGVVPAIAFLINCLTEEETAWLFSGLSIIHTPTIRGKQPQSCQQPPAPQRKHVCNGFR